jgi:Rrf2 family transcriptional regulator, cysteine metabolism repressor
MIQVSTNGRYALRLMLDLALNQNKGPVLREQIANRQGVSADYTAQLFRKLTRAGLAKGIMGPGGGYLLGNDPAKIRVGDIIRATEGPITLVHCVNEKEANPCERAENCIARRFWVLASQNLEQFLDATTLGDLVKDARNLGWLENGLFSAAGAQPECA